MLKYKSQFQNKRDEEKRRGQEKSGPGGNYLRPSYRCGNYNSTPVP
jgi:hypothetical protein